jgi:outer membrane protein OmpA-like peptidoglycan-associated protein
MDAQDSADGAREEARMKAEAEASLQAEEAVRLAAAQDSLNRAEEESRVIAENTERERVEKERAMKEEEEARHTAEETARLEAVGIVAAQDSLNRAEEEARVIAENTEKERVEQERVMKEEEEARRTAEETVRLEAEAAVVAAQATARKQEETEATEAAAQGVEDQLNFNDILFDFDKATLRNESKTELDAVQTYLAQYSKAQIIIGGHADAIGTENYNMLLSERRAQKAAAHLIDRGINESQLVLYAFGKSKPITPNTNSDGTDNPVGRQKNRRVEFSDTQSSQDLAGGRMIAFSRRVANQTKQITRSAIRSGTFYTVQVAAYKYPKNYVHTSLNGLGEVKPLDVDGITRFTIGRFDKLKEARQFKKLVVEMGTADAFITAEVDGERRYLNEIYLNGGMADSRSIQSASPAARIAYKRVMDTYGAKRAEGLEFNVQVQAYAHTENYSAGTLKTHEGAKPKRAEETFIPFTIGNFETLREAEEFKKSMANSGANDAFITAKHNGQKVLIRDLIDNNFYTL